MLRSMVAADLPYIAKQQVSREVGTVIGTCQIARWSGTAKINRIYIYNAYTKLWGQFITVLV